MCGRSLLAEIVDGTLVGVVCVLCDCSASFLHGDFASCVSSWLATRLVLVHIRIVCWLVDSSRLCWGKSWSCKKLLRVEVLPHEWSCRFSVYVAWFLNLDLRILVEILWFSYCNGVSIQTLIEMLIAASDILLAVHILTRLDSDLGLISSSSSAAENLCPLPWEIFKRVLLRIESQSFFLLLTWIYHSSCFHFECWCSL